MAGSTTNPYADPTASAAVAAATAPVKASQPSSFDNLMRDLGGIFSSTQPGESRKSILGMGDAAVDRIDDWLDYEAPELVNFATYALPYIGTMRLIQDATENREQGEWGKWAGDLGLAALSLIPGLGGVGAGLAKSGIKGASSIAKGIGKLTGRGERAARGLAKSADDIAKTGDDIISQIKAAGRNLTAEEEAAIKAQFKLSDEELAALKKAEKGPGSWADNLTKIGDKGIGSEAGQFASAGGRAQIKQANQVLEGLGKGSLKETGKSVAAREKAAKAIKEFDEAESTLQQALDKIVGFGKKKVDPAAVEEVRSVLRSSPEELAKFEEALGAGPRTNFGRPGRIQKFGEQAKAGRTRPTMPEAEEEWMATLGKGAEDFNLEELSQSLHQAISDLAKSQGREDTLAQWLLSPRTRDGKVFKSSIPAWAGRGVVAGMGQANGPGTSPDAMAYYLQRLMQQQANGEGMYRYYDPSRQ